MSDQGLPEMQVEPVRRSFWRNLSPVWLVPILALIVAIGVAWRSYSERGALIRITFENASGIVAGETTVRYRDVVIGTVEDLSFTPDLAQVIVSARIKPEVADAISSDAKFWVVRPQVSARGVTGLNTVLSGVYIQAVWTPSDRSGQRDFTGLEEPPLVTPGESGTRITIRAKDGNRLNAGAPVLFRGIEVGKLERPELSPDGDSVLVQAFINAPYDKQLTTATRFWDMSGFSVKFGAGGLELSVASLAALVSGGVAFDSVVGDGRPIRTGRIFDLYPDESAARESIFSALGDNAVSFAIDFTGTVNGLTAGAPVMFKGIRVGVVKTIGAVVEQRDRGRVVHLRTTVEIDPQAVGLPQDAGESELMNFLSDAVEKGLRARLATQNLFSASLEVELVELPDATPAVLSHPEGRLPVIPSVVSEIPDVTATAEGVLKRINELPIEQLMNKAISLMDSVQKIAEAEGTRQTPEELAGLLRDTRALVNQPDTQAIPAELRDTIAQLRAITEELREKGAADRLVAALESADKAAAAIADISGDVPPLVTDLRNLTQKANALDIEALVTSAREVLNNADALIGSDEAKQIPPALNDALDQVRDVVAEFKSSGAIDHLTAALASADSAAQGVSRATEGIPELSAKLSELADKANALKAEELVAAATQALDSVDALIGTDEARQLPPVLTGALGQVRDAVSEFRGGGGVQKLTDAIGNADVAARNIASAAEGIPELRQKLSDLADKANALKAEDLVQSATKLMDSTDALIGTDAARQVPPALAEALDQVRDALAELRAGGTIENANATFASARSAADAVAEAAQRLPELADRLDRVARQAEGLVAAYGQRSDFNQQTLDTLREMRDAARSVAQLARAIQRNPSSLITGR